jgi:hypothetical protein
MKSRKAVQLLSKAEKLANEFITLQAQLKPLEERIKEVRAELTPFVESTPGQSLIFSGRKFCMITQTRENFDLKTARTVLDNDELQRFVKVSVSKYLKCQ